MIDLTSWPGWTGALAWTVATLAASWGLGILLGKLAASRMPTRLPERHQALMSDAARRVRARLRWWCLLVGVWVAASYWPLTTAGSLLVERTVFVIGTVSVTLVAATVAARAIGVYGAVIAPALRVTTLTSNIVWALVAILGLLVLLNGLGLSITPMLTALGVGGLAVALALQEPLANFFAGVFLTLGGQIRTGDYVRLDFGQEGYVTDFSWRSTRLRMLPNNLVVVPNAKLAQAIVTNLHLPTKDLADVLRPGATFTCPATTRSPSSR